MKRIIVLILVFVLLLCMNSATAASFDPHKATAYMDIKFECGCWGTGTGAMVGRHGLITCAHNLCCPSHGKWYKSITFVFGAKSANSGQKKVSSGFSAWVYDTFQNGYNSEDDIGYVVFNKPIGDSTGWFATHAASDTDVEYAFTNVYKLVLTSGREAGASPSHPALPLALTLPRAIIGQRTESLYGRTARRHKTKSKI